MKFALEEYHRNVPEKELLGDLKRVASQLGKRSITKVEYDKHGKYHSSTFLRRVGTWSKILSTAGLERTRNYGITKEELVADLIRVSKKSKKNSVTRLDYEAYGKYSASTFIVNFGSWFKALEKAGLQRTRTLGVSDEEYFNNLQEVWTKLGRQPRYADMRKPLSKYSAGAYEYRFGTWRKALERFIEYVSGELSQAAEERIQVVLPSNVPRVVPRHKTKRNISSRLRFIIMKRDNFKCRNCGRSPATDPKVVLHVDHTKPYSKGGETLPENLETLCSECNLGKGNL